MQEGFINAYLRIRPHRIEQWEGDIYATREDAETVSRAMKAKTIYRIRVKLKTTKNGSIWQ
jgi:hypothetical protein